MKLSVRENIWSESLELISKESVFTKDVKIIFLLLILVIVELPIFLILIEKLLVEKKELLLFTFVIVFLVLVSLIFISAPAKLFLISIQSSNKFMELGWIKYRIFRRKEKIPFEHLLKINVSLYRIGKEKRIRMEVETNYKKITAFFEIDENENNEDLAKIFLNLAFISGFQTYTAYHKVDGFRINFSKGFDERRKITDSGELFFEEEKIQIERNSINIPYLIIEELGPSRIKLYRKPNTYDILRLLLIFVVFPVLLIMLLFFESSKNPLSLILPFTFYILILNVMRKMIAPVNVTIDRLRGVITVKKLIISVIIPISQIKQIEIRDQISSRTGTFLFYVDARTNSDKKYQLFFTEFPRQTEKIYRTFEDLTLFLDYISKVLEIPVINLCNKI